MKKSFKKAVFSKILIRIKYFLTGIFFTVFLISNPVFGQIVQLDSSIQQFELKKYCSFIKTSIDSIELSELENKKWIKNSKGANLGVTKYFYWFKYEFNNPYPYTINFNLYIPYHHQRAINIYRINKEDSTLIAKYGTSRNYFEKDVETPGYVKKISFQPGLTKLFFHVNHFNMPMRANCYLLSTEKLDEVLQKTENSYSIWFTIILIALSLSLILFFITKMQIFLSYFFLNLGIICFIGIEIGGFFKFFEIDKYLLLFDIKHLGVITVLLFFPLFLNRLTPISKVNPRLWRTMYYLIFLALISWIIGLSDSIKYTTFFLINVWYLIVLTGAIFLIQLYFLFNCLMQKEKNSLILFIVYLLYIFAVTYEVILPNIGVKADSIYVYDMLLKTSIIEIFLFSILIVIEMNLVFRERNRLLIHEKELQSRMLKAIVESQEKERNKLGMELHDMIGANLAVVKQNTDKENNTLIKIIDETIDSVRALSHGLITPKVLGEQLKDEIIDLCLLCTNERLKINYYFHNWHPLKNEENSTHLYRIFQELLQNTIKHSLATEVYLQINRNQEDVLIFYEDNGQGFNIEKKQKEGKGLLGISHRVEILKGELRYDSSNNGTTVGIPSSK